MTLTGDKNHNWKGGRSITEHGYVLIRVGKEHHLADVRGYAYEHRLVAEKILGRRLKPGEVVHHIDENRLNNSPSNIEITPSIAHHRAKHRTREGMRDPGEPNPLIECACGCGSKFKKFDDYGRPRKYALGGHWRRARCREK